jgi:methylated-DNA-protein-cysteine methyltransferase-like protein
VVGRGFHEQVWEVVRKIPAGRVTTFGDIAAELGLRSVARQVGWALAALPPDHDDVPWFRVVNAKGELSRRADGSPSLEQVERLAADGVSVSASGRVEDFKRLRIGPPRGPEDLP